MIYIHKQKLQNCYPLQFIYARVWELRLVLNPLTLSEQPTNSKSENTAKCLALIIWAEVLLHQLAQYGDTSANKWPC